MEWVEDVMYFMVCDRNAKASDAELFQLRLESPFVLYSLWQEC